MNFIIIGIGILLTILITFFVILGHDTAIMSQKQNDIIKQIREKETCNQLKDDINFINDMNKGYWIKQFDDSDVQKYYQEKNCK